MKITVVVHDAEQTVSMYGDDTIAALKRRTKCEERWLADANGNCLDDDATLTSCGLRSGARLVAKSGGNGVVKSSCAVGAPPERAPAPRSLAEEVEAKMMLRKAQTSALSQDAIEQFAAMEAERLAELDAANAEVSRAVSLGIKPKGRNLCMCGVMFFGWEKTLQHFDRSSGPHRIRAEGDEAPWDGPVEIPQLRQEAGPNPGCSMAHQALAAQHRCCSLSLGTAHFLIACASLT